MKRSIIKPLIIISGILTSTGNLCASDEKSASPNWDHIEVGYFSTDINGIDASPSGIGGGLTSLLSENVYITLNTSYMTDTFRVVDIDVDVDVSQSSIGLGYIFNTTDNTDLFVSANYINMEVCAEAILYGSDCVDDDGYSIEAGVRSMVSNQVELYSKAGHLDFGEDSDTALAIGLLYDFQNDFALKFEYASADDVDTFGLSLRYMF